MDIWMHFIIYNIFKTCVQNIPKTMCSCASEKKSQNFSKKVTTLLVHTFYCCCVLWSTSRSVGNSNFYIFHKYQLTAELWLCSIWIVAFFRCLLTKTCYIRLGIKICAIITTYVPIHFGCWVISIMFIPTLDISC